MTKKDYIAIARMFKNINPGIPPLDALDRPQRNASYTMWYMAVQDMADTLQADNGRFDRLRFLDACGLLG